MSPVIHYGQWQQSSKQAASLGCGWLIPGAIDTATLFTTPNSLDESCSHFPVKRNQGRMPPLPYRSLDPGFRQLLLELTSSITIRLLEKISQQRNLLADPLFEQAVLGKAPQIKMAACRAAQKAAYPIGLSPAIAGILFLSSQFEYCGTCLFAGDLWLQPMHGGTVSTPASETGKALFFLYYTYHTSIAHGSVKLRE